MSAPDSRHRTQEQSIKARKHQLFGTDEVQHETGPRRTFAECLRETPASPLSPPVKTSLWIVGTLVILLLLGALAQSVIRKPRPRARPAASASSRTDLNQVRSIERIRSDWGAFAVG